MKIKIEQENRYKITIAGIEYDGLKFDGEWEGFLKFSGTEGVVIVHDQDDTSFLNIFETFFQAKSNKKPVDFSVVKISPNLMPAEKKET